MENKLTALICTCCGGQIDRGLLICRNCGTQFKYDSNNRLITVEQFNRKIIYINGAVMVPAFYVNEDPEAAMRLTLDEIAREMAKKILPLIEFQTRFNPHEQTFITSAKIGVAEPFNYSGMITKQYNFTPGEFWEVN